MRISGGFETVFFSAAGIKIYIIIGKTYQTPNFKLAAFSNVNYSGIL